MRFQRTVAAFIAVATALAPLSTSSISTFIPSAVSAEDNSKGAALPEWIPYDYDTALKFRNTYGATHIQDGLVCIVFKEQYESVPTDVNEELLSYKVKTTDNMMKELKHSIYISKDSNYVYEAVVYFAPQKQVNLKSILWITGAASQLFLLFLLLFLQLLIISS